MNSPLPDQSQRLLALDEQQSFLVQAPAGSGKTELLTQRYLKLLATSVHYPEEIIAITFTRKAAGEMRQRILHALEKGKEDEPVQTHQQLTWQLAKQVLFNDEKYGWQILENPNRLRILTIDSLCAKITAQMPILSRFGAQPGITEQAYRFYQQAAQSILATLNHTDLPWSEALKKLLLHLDNDHDKAERLLNAMLANRDQWLLHSLNLNREDFEAVLETIVKTSISKTINQLFKLVNQDELLYLWQHASANLKFPINDFNFQNEIGYLSDWQKIATWLLTTEGEIRKTVTVKQGFLAPSSFRNPDEKAEHEQLKQHILCVLEILREDKNIAGLLLAIKNAPPPCYGDEQWALIEALIQILNITTAQLHLLFKENRLVDHTEIALRAVSALGHYDNPSDLALALDNKISHILVDEFQDTSITQFKLLEQLTAGWQINDGRTLFLVGDPMQSIYRFRKAEVGLFLLVKHHGIGFIKPKFLELTTNFRSSSTLVHWFNDYFSMVFPQEENLTTGAITFAKANAIHENSTSSVEMIALDNADDFQEAEQIIKIIQQHPNQRIAILVLAKNHLTKIIEQLQQHHIAFRAVDIAALADKTICQDLLALCDALLQPFDRVAWLSVLRAPYCGLTLDDLYVIANQPGGPISYVLQNHANLSLSPDGHAILTRIAPVLQQTLANRQRMSLASTLEATWINLGGPACVQSNEDLQDATCFFDFVKHLEKEHTLLNHELITRSLQKLAAKGDSKESMIDIMTIHKSKGLEFDVVILPSLEKSKRIDNHPLLLWQEFPNQQGFENLLVAPIKDKEDEPIYDYLRDLEQQKAQYEQMRLLYVACTRAKQHLYLVAKPKIDMNDQRVTPNKQSFLSLLWPLFQTAKSIVSSTENTTHSETEKLFLRRLMPDWQNPIIKNDMIQKGFGDNKPIFSDQSSAILGTIIHKMLQEISAVPEEWLEHQEILETKLINLMHQQRTPMPMRKEILQAGLNCIAHIKNNEKASWIFAKHQGAASEFTLSYIEENSGEYKTAIIDRTFLFNNVRYIIDYKTTVYLGDDLNMFLQAEKRLHEKQLHLYAKILKNIYKFPIQLMLYFPMVPAWIEWEYRG